MVHKVFKRVSSQRGDTIIEVVIAMAVLGLVLGASAVLVSRNSKTMQTSQENAVALRVAQEQIEYLQFFAGSQPDALPSASETFCMLNENTKTTHGTECARENGGAKYVTSMNLVRHPDSVNGDYYDVYIDVTWETLSGVPGNVELSQRIYKKSGTSVSDFDGTCRAGHSFVPGVPCVANRPSVKVNVKKINPNSATLDVPYCNSSAAANRSGTNVNLSGSGVNVNKSTGGDSSALFSGLIPGESYSASVTAPWGYSLCPPGSVSTGVLPPGITSIHNFKIVPHCSVGSSNSHGHWQNEYGPDTPVYRSDPVWEMGRGPGFNQPGYPGGWSNGWLPWNGNHFFHFLPAYNHTYIGEWTGAKQAVGGQTEFWYVFHLWMPVVVGYQPVHIGDVQGPLVSQVRTVTTTTTRTCTDSGSKSAVTYTGTERRTSGW